MALSEIEKLERRYAENPQGLTFAPLAEVHRKNGEVQRALDLLGPGLAIHPDYIPASIVLGRCHLDLGDVPAAETAFRHVLALDGENVIALKALADICERLLKLEEAERWLHTLLSLDRSNEEAREQLQRVEIARRQAEVASAAEPSSVESEAGPAVAVAVSAAPEGDAAAAAPEGVTPEASTPERTASDAAAPPPFEPPVAEPAMGWVSQSSEAAGLASSGLDALEPSALGDRIEEPPGLELEEPVAYEDAVEPLDGLVGREVDTPEVEGEEFRVETSEDIILRSLGGGEFQVPDASQELIRGSTGRGAAPTEPEPGRRAETGRWWERAAEPELPAPELELSAPSAPAPTAPSAPEYEPAEPAAAQEPRVPEVAAAGAPADDEVESVAELEPVADPEPETVPARDSAPETASPVPSESASAPPPKRAYAAEETGGRPVGQFLKDILSARPPAQASAASVRQAPGQSGSGAPTRPAPDALSLSSVFGEEAPETPPAVPAPSQGSGVSFDDFFSGPNATPASRAARPQDPKNDDLDQFHAWLQNLKR